MIFARVDSSRNFVGCLDPQSELLGSLLALCKDKGVSSAVFSGYGYLENPETRLYSRTEKQHISARKEEGVYACPVIQGSISVGEDGQPGIIVFVQGTAAARGRSKALSGELVSATVLQFEFSMQTVDNVTLNRLKEKKTGMRLWLQMLPAGVSAQAAGLVPDSVDDEEEEELVGEEDEYTDDDLQIEEGDWLNHPRLGMCYVITFDGEDRIKVRLKSGRIAELMLTMFRLKLEGVQEGGKVFQVTVRKRR